MIDEFNRVKVVVLDFCWRYSEGGGMATVAVFHIEGNGSSGNTSSWRLERLNNRVLAYKPISKITAENRVKPGDLPIFLSEAYTAARTA
jgi:hypothetical protein